MPAARHAPPIAPARLPAAGGPVRGGKGRAAPRPWPARKWGQVCRPVGRPAGGVRRAFCLQPFSREAPLLSGTWYLRIARRRVSSAKNKKQVPKQ